MTVEYLSPMPEAPQNLLIPQLWTYSMEQYFRIEHPELTSLNDPRLSVRFRRAIRTTKEQIRLKIPEQYLVDNGIFNEHDAEEVQSRGKRKRVTNGVNTLYVYVYYCTTSYSNF